MKDRRTPYLIFLMIGYFCIHAFLPFLGQTHTVSPLDEILAALLVLPSMLILFRRMGEVKWPLFFYTIYLLNGFYSAFTSGAGGIPQPQAAFYTAILDTKGPIFFLGFYWFLRNNSNIGAIIRILGNTLIVIAIINFPFVLFQSFGDGKGFYGQSLFLRSGFYQPNGLFWHHIQSAWLVLSATFFALYLFRDRKSLFYGVLAAVLAFDLFLHFSFKESLCAILGFALFVNRRHLTFLQISKMALYSIMLFGIIYLLTPIGNVIDSQVLLYFSKESIDSTARTALTIQSFSIASDFFPFGTGLGTYCSPSSFKMGYSSIYITYGLSTIFGASPDQPRFLLDVFWPKILAEGGWVGLFAYLAFIFSVFRAALSEYSKRGSSLGWLSATFCISILVVSLGASVLSDQLMGPLFNLLCAASLGFEKKIRNQSPIRG